MWAARIIERLFDPTSYVWPVLFGSCALGSPIVLVYVIMNS